MVYITNYVDSKLSETTYNPVIVKDRNITTAIQIFQSCFER